jgi:hypothetical protein
LPTDPASSLESAPGAAFRACCAEEGAEEFAEGAAEEEDEEVDCACAPGTAENISSAATVVKTKTSKRESITFMLQQHSHGQVNCAVFRMESPHGLP